MDLQTYQGMKYGQDIHGKWFFIFPSGLRSYPPAVQSDEDIKKLIDSFVGPPVT